VCLGFIVDVPRRPADRPRVVLKAMLLSAVLALEFAPGASAQSPVRTDRFEVDGVHVTMEYVDERIAALHPRAQTLVRDAWPRVVALFGGPPQTATRTPYDAFIVTLSYGQGEGRSDPQRITLRTTPETLVFGYSTWEDAVLHELLHFWNANTFRSVSERELWFSEGVTEYYALRIARELGLLSAEQLAAHLVTLVGHYMSDAGIGTIPVAGAVTRSQHYFLMYAGGATAAAVLDFDIRLATGGARSFADVLRSMYRKYDAGTRRYSNADLRAELEAIAGKSYADFFARYIEGTEIIPVGRYFSLTDVYFLDVPQRFDRNSAKGRTLRDMFAVP
jgi:predicted metalloprotease with PDZ domain